MKRNPVNLATEPIEAVRRARRIVLWAAAVIGALTLVHVGLLAWSFGAGERVEVDPGPAVAPERLAAWQNEVEALAGAADIQRARRTALAVELGEQLVAWRTIPWSALFGDLETVLPDRVRLAAVQPVVDETGRVRVSMTAVAADTGPLQDLLIALEQSAAFRRAVPQREDVGEDGLLRMQLSAEYAPALPVAETPAGGGR